MAGGSPMRRPWKVFVFDIGPSFSFASEERAVERASALVASEYAAVSVYQVDQEIRSATGLTRTVFRHDAEPTVERFDGRRWEALP